MFLSGKFAAWC